MNATLALVVSLGIGYPPATDLYGDALPEGASARLGTLKLRALCDHVHFAPDGKTLIGINDGRRVRVWDASDGKLLEARLLPGRPERFGTGAAYAWSRDGAVMVVEGQNLLEMWDIVQGKRLPATFPKNRRDLLRWAVSEDRAHVICAESTSVVPFKKGGPPRQPLYRKQGISLCDTTAGTARLLADDDQSVTSLAFAPDGKRVAASAYRTGTRVWDVASGKQLWKEPLFNAEMVAFTPDGQHLIGAPGGGQSTWQIWEAATGKPATILQAPTAGYAWSFAVSPDGRLLLIPTMTDYILWDMHAGKERQRWPGAHQAGRGVFAPDGKSAVTYDTVLRRWDVSTGTPLFADMSLRGHTASVARVFIAPDGKRLVSIGADHTIRTWDVADGKLLGTTAHATASEKWALTADGATLVAIDDGLTVQRWSHAEGKLLPPVKLSLPKEPNLRLQHPQVQLGADGRTLTVAARARLPGKSDSAREYVFSHWDAATGRFEGWGGNPGIDLDSAVLSPGARFAAGRDTLYGTRDGARLPLAGESILSPGKYVFSPDGRLLAGGRANGVRIWDTATGRTLLNLPDASMHHALFAPDGRHFAFAFLYSVQVWDLRTGKRVLYLTVPENQEEFLRGTSTDVAFAPDSRTLATGHAEGTILLWPMPPPSQVEPPTDAEQATLWAELAQADPKTAYAALWRFRDDPSATVRFLSQRFATIETPQGAEVKMLLRGLASDKFAEREAASRRLKALGRVVAAPLRQALKAGPTLEQKRRLEALLAALENAPWPMAGDELRAVRAVAVLEGCATPAARELLETWATRVPDARLSEEAAFALNRLKWRVPAK